MSVYLSDNAYGKSHVRFTKVTRRADRHELKEISADIQLRGQFDACYHAGDNSMVLPTDTMKNTVYALAARHAVESVEAFALFMADHFINHPQTPHCESVAITLRESRWNRIQVNGQPHAWAFTSGGDEKRVCTVTRSRNEIKLQGGIENLVVLKTTDSGFINFIRDSYTTLPDTADRIFATSIKATWNYIAGEHDWNAAYDSIRNAIIQTFARHQSLAVQQTLYAMGEAAMGACGAIDEIAFELPNQHRVPMNLEPLGLKNSNEIFITTSEPFGLICGTIKRK
jgi:urate oxidase